MAAVKISGVLKDGAGKPIQNCTIQLKAKRNSTTVLVNTVASENPDEAGRYSMDVEYGQYSVILLVEGFPPSHAGTITVYEGSRPGTLNDFLGAMTEDDVMPERHHRVQRRQRNPKRQQPHRRMRRKPQKRMQLTAHRRQRPRRLHRQTPRQQPKNQKPARKIARQPQRPAKKTQNPARRQRKPVRRMPKTVKPTQR